MQHDLDPDGNPVINHVPGFCAVWLDYSQRNQLPNIYSNGQGTWFTYAYDAAGNLTKRKDVYNGVNDSTNCPTEQYDALNRPMMWEQTDSGGPFARSWYQYDNVGREVATWRDEDNGLGSGRGERFWYSSTNQLTNARYDANNVSTGSPQNPVRSVDYYYSPDKLNRQSMTDNGQTTTYGVDGMNQYVSLNGAASQYDQNFNLYTLNGWTYGYDVEKHLLWTINGATSASFLYDGLGRCVRRTINGVTTLITYDGWKPIVEWDVNGNLSAVNVYGPGADEILYRYIAAGNQRYRYHLDPHGNVAFLLDWTGAVIEKYAYDAFGQPIITDFWGNPRYDAQGHYASWCGNRFMFQGRESFVDLGIYDYRHRFYHPSLGRFLQTDPTGFDAGDMNLFRYCGDDPVDRTGPTGLVATDAASSIWNRLRIFDTSSSSQESLWSLNKAQDRTWAVRNLTAALVDETPGTGSKSAPAAIRRYTVEGPYVEKTGNGFVVHIPWTLQLLDKDGNPTFGKGIFIDENVDRIKRVNFDPSRHTERGHVTKERGVADDGWHLGFKGPTGQVTIVQTMIVEGRQAKFPDTTVKYDGREAEVEPPGAWAPFSKTAHP